MITLLLFTFIYSTLGLMYFIFGVKFNPPQEDDEMADHVVTSFMWPIGAIFNLVSNICMFVNYLTNGKASKSLATIGYRLARLFN